MMIVLHHSFLICEIKSLVTFHQDKNKTLHCKQQQRRKYIYINKTKSSIEMNDFRIDDYLTNSDHWIFPQQIDYSTNQAQFIELSNVHHDIHLSNEINSNTFNLPAPSSIMYDFPLPQNSSSTLRLDKSSLNDQWE
jgi:hypothetical protein